MDETKALAIVSALADGVNPLTGEIFPTDSPYQNADVVRALVLASRALDTRSKARARATLPDNAGKPWTADEDHRLLAAFDRGGSLADLARAHGRTVAGIQARLEKHGRLQAADLDASPRRWRSASGPSEQVR
jgi:hypothetical protein